MKRKAHIYVSGIVQGVFFRSNVRSWAQKCGVEGWVRNLHDGRVEAVFEGEEERVKEAISFCRIGPPGARVDKVDVEWEDYKGEFGSFEIRY